jgi:hypothetical protein
MSIAVRKLEMAVQFGILLKSEMALSWEKIASLGAVPTLVVE